MYAYAPLRLIVLGEQHCGETEMMTAFAMDPSPGSLGVNSTADLDPPLSPSGSEATAAQNQAEQSRTYGMRLNHRCVRHGKASIELVLEPGGRLRRFVVLDSEKLRVALGQPRRREIDPMYAQQEHFELRTSELWALAEDQARTSLRKLYAKLAEQSSASTGSKTRRPRAQPLGQLQAPETAEQRVRGELLYAGPTANGQFCLELLEDGRRVRSIEGLDLARALQVAGAQLRDTIVVERGNTHEVTIREERSGSHGEGSRSLRRGRETFTITVESRLESDLDAQLPNRSQRSPSSAS